MWKNMSLSEPVSINPKPLSVSRLIVPSGICPIPEKRNSAVESMLYYLMDSNNNKSVTGKPITSTSSSKSVEIPGVAGTLTACLFTALRLGERCLLCLSRVPRLDSHFVQFGNKSDVNRLNSTRAINPQFQRTEAFGHHLEEMLA